MHTKHSSKFLTGLQINCAYLRGWPLFLTVPYAAAICGLIAFFDAPFSRFLGLSHTDASVILDAAILIALPTGLIFWHILRRHNRHRLNLREGFLAAHAQHRLLASRYAPQNVYRVTGGDPASGRIEVRPVWNVDGPVTGGEAYPADISAFEPLVPSRFLAG